MKLPVDIEVALYRATRDASYRAELEAHRTDERWLRDQGFEEGSRRLLAAAPDASVEQLIDAIGRQPIERRAFLGAVAAAAVASAVPMTAMAGEGDVTDDDPPPVSGDPPTVELKKAVPDYENQVKRGIAPLKPKLVVSISVAGVIEDEDVQGETEALVKRTAAFRHCALKTGYDTLLGPGGTGEIEVEIIIGTKADITIKKAKSTPFSQDLESCVEAKMQQVAFPEGKEPRMITATITFTAPG